MAVGVCTPLCKNRFPCYTPSVKAQAGSAFNLLGRKFTTATGCRNCFPRFQSESPFAESNSAMCETLTLLIRRQRRSGPFDGFSAFPDPDIEQAFAYIRTRIRVKVPPLTHARGIFHSSQPAFRQPFRWFLFTLF